MQLIDILVPQTQTNLYRSVQGIPIHPFLT